MVRADRRDVELGEPLGRLGGGDTRDRLRVLVEGQESDDREGGGAPHSLDRIDHFLEVVERLDHEDVDAAAFEHGRLLDEEIVTDA